MRGILFALLAASGFVIGSAQAVAGSFTYMLYPLLPDQYGVYFYIGGINNAGQISGSYGQSGVIPGYVCSPASCTVVTYAQGSDTFLGQINNNGITYGYAAGSTSKARFTYDTNSSTFTQIKAPHGFGLYANGINDSNVLAGTAEKKNVNESFYTKNGKAKLFTYNGALTEALGVDNAGLIFGTFRVPNSAIFQGFTDLAGVFTAIAVPDASYTAFQGESQGVLFGTYTGQNGTAGLFTYLSGQFSYYQGESLAGLLSDGSVIGNSAAGPGFTYVNGQYYPVVPPGANNSTLGAVSANGIIAGVYSDGKEFHLFTAVCPPNQQPCTQ